MRRRWWWLVAVWLWAGCGQAFVGPDPSSDPEAVFDAFWEAYDRHYAHFGLKDIDWDGVYDKYAPQIGPHTTDEQLFEILGEMLLQLEDGHVYLVGDERRAVSNREIRSARRTFDAQLVEQQYLGVSKETGKGNIVYGRVGRGLGYIRLSTLSGGEGFGLDARGWIEDIDEAIDALRDAPGMIIDLRNNGGGRASNAKFVGSRFANERRSFLVTRSRNGPAHDDFSAPRTWHVESATDDPYVAPVVVLTNRNTFSAAEWLTLALRQFDHVVHMGTQTGGGLAMFLPRELPNGWMHTVSVQDTRCPLGRSYERIGITPHRYSINGDRDIDDERDRMLEEAIEFLQN